MSHEPSGPETLVPGSARNGNGGGATVPAAAPRATAGTIEAKPGAIDAKSGWDGIDRRRNVAPEVDALRVRLVSRLEHRRLAWRVLADFCVFLLAMLAAFGACWIVALVLNAATLPPDLTTAAKVGGMFASGGAAVYGAVVSWRIGWRSFFVGWLAGGKLYLAAALLGF